MSSTRKPRNGINGIAMHGARGEGTSGGDSAAQPAEPLAFEEALGRLDETVAALESGQLPLEDALRLYEEGVRMAQRCQEMLDSAELRVQRLRMDSEHEDDQSPSSVFVLEEFELEDE